MATETINPNSYKWQLENGGKLLAKIPSDKNPKNVYKIIESADGYLYCSCASWVFSTKDPKERSCKHIKKYNKSPESYKPTTTIIEEGEIEMETVIEEKEIVAEPKKAVLAKMTDMIGLEYEERILESVMRMGMTALLIGETGTGKTTLARKVAEYLGKQVRRVNLDGGVTPDELIGRIMLKGSDTFFEKGIIPKAMEEGACLILDEVNACLPDTLFVLHALLERPSRLLIPETGEEITPANGFCVIATMNPSHDYAGTKGLNPAFYSRFGVTLRFASLVGEKLCMALGTHSPKSPANHVAEVAWCIETIEKFRKEEKINTRISIREGISALMLANDGLTLDEAIDVCIISRLERDEVEELSKAGGRVKVKTSIADSVEEMIKRASESASYIKEINKLKKQMAKYEKFSEMMKMLSEDKEK